MAGGVDVLLRKIDEGVAELRDHYEADLAAKDVSDDLLYAIMHVVSDCLAALDRTASAVKGKYGPAGGRSPYFPLRLSPEDFDKSLNEQIKNLRKNAPNVADAIERHQPYQPGKGVLGHLHKLGRVNKHQDFTPQTKVEHRAAEFRFPGGGSIIMGEGASIHMGPGTDIISGGRSIRQIQPRQLVYVDWRFVDPPLSVLPTLEALATLVRDAVEDVRREAQL